MKRLRHPVRAIEEPFGKAGLVVAVIALVLALTGAAFAAAGLTGKQKKEVEKIAKKFAGKPGAAGAAGPQGPAGAAGKDGANGTNGKDGTNGTDGQSVTLGAATGCGVPGGTKLTVGASSKEVCNGKEGEEGEEGEPGPPGAPGSPGPEGSPWTAGGTLPAGAQLTGTWFVDGSGPVETPISFPIHLAGLVAAGNIYYGAGVEEEELEPSPGVKEKTEFQKHCNKSAINPEVAVGNNRTLCIYYFKSQSTSTTFERFTVGGDDQEGNPGSPNGGRAGGFLRLNITKPGSVTGSYAISGG